MKLSFAFGVYRKIGRRQGENYPENLQSQADNCSASRLLFILFFEIFAYLQFKRL